MGKNVGDDLAEGKPTLPVMYAMQHGSSEQSDIIRNAIKQGDNSQLSDVLLAIQQTGALDYCRKQAERFSNQANQALETLPESQYKQALLQLTELALARTQ